MKPISIGGNTASRTVRFLRKLQDQGALASERLASGSRIVKGVDDAAGLSIAKELRLDSRIYQQARRNVNDGISLLNVADGALEVMEQLTFRKAELAEQAANGVYTSKQRQALNNELKQLVDEYNRIVRSTEFNGIRIFDGTLREGLAIQAGYGEEAIRRFAIGASLNQVTGNGSFQPVQVIPVPGDALQATFGDFNEDGNNDIVTVGNSPGDVTVLLGDGSGGYTVDSTFSAGGIGGRAIISGDYNGDGNLDMVTANRDSDNISVFFGNGDGTFGAPNILASGDQPFDLKTGDFDSDGFEDLIVPSRLSDNVTIYYGDGIGSFGITQTFASGAGDDPRSVAIGDYNNDDIDDFAVSHEGVATPGVTIFLSNGDRTYSSFDQNFGGAVRTVESGDFNGDGNVDLVATRNSLNEVAVHLGNGDGTFTLSPYFNSGSAGPTKIGVGDLNGDFNLDFAIGGNSSTEGTIFFGNGDGTFSAPVALPASTEVFELSFVDLNNDGGLDVLGALPNANSLGLFIVDTTSTAILPQLDITTQSRARNALDTINTTLERVIAERGGIGAFMKQLELSSSNLGIMNENVVSAESRITDADVAEETATFLRTSIQQNTISALQSRENAGQKLAFDLILLATS